MIGSPSVTVIRGILVTEIEGAVLVIVTVFEKISAFLRHTRHRRLYKRRRHQIRYALSGRYRRQHYLYCYSLTINEDRYQRTDSDGRSGAGQSYCLYRSASGERCRRSSVYNLTRRIHTGPVSKHPYRRHKLNYFICGQSSRHHSSGKRCLNGYHQSFKCRSRCSLL